MNFEGESGPRILAIIPARSGSKRIPGKNMATLNGRRMMSWPIEALRNSSFSVEIVLTTDSREIQKLGSELAVDTVLGRPSTLADDYSTSIEVIRWAAEEMKLGDEDFIIMSYPTSVFLSPEIVNTSLGLALGDPNKFVATVQEANSKRPLHELQESETFAFVEPLDANQRTQDVASTYQDAGQIYVGRKALWMIGQPFVSPTIGIKLGKNQAVDIDDPGDLLLASAILRTGRY